jgi:hypothetical protein
MSVYEALVVSGVALGLDGAGIYQVVISVSVYEAS